MAKKAKTSEELIEIRTPDISTLYVRVVGTAPLMQNKFSRKSQETMSDKMAKGESLSRDRTKGRCFETEARDACYRSADGWVGVNATAIKSACVRAAQISGIPMTQARLALHVEQDGIDVEDGMPLCRLDAGEYKVSVMPVRNKNGGTDMRSRPVWHEWALDLRITYDEAIIKTTSIVNLLIRAGMQNGIGEGRPGSRMSSGLGYGTFKVDLDSIEVVKNSVG